MGSTKKNLMTDEKIIELYWERDESAITRTDEKYGLCCFYIAHNILGSREDSEECVNDTWLQTWLSIPPQRPSFLRQFLIRITRNLSLDYYRHNHAKKRGGGELAAALDELSECVSGAEDTETAVSKRQLEEAVNAFIGSLPVKERSVFIRRYFFMEKTARIAERYLLTEGNVRKILSRVRAKLKEYLLKEGFEV